MNDSFNYNLSDWTTSLWIPLCFDYLSSYSKLASCNDPSNPAYDVMKKLYQRAPANFVPINIYASISIHDAMMLIKLGSVLQQHDDIIEVD